MHFNPTHFSVVVVILAIHLITTTSTTTVVKGQPKLCSTSTK